MGPGCLPLSIFFILLIVLPLAFAQVLTSALLKLHLSPGVALILVVGIIMGSAVNIPVKRIERTDQVAVHPLSAFGVWGFWPQLERFRSHTVIAVNLGGAVIPTALAAYEAFHVFRLGPGPFGGMLLAILVNVAVCYWIATPVQGVGIAMPGLIPPLVAVVCAMMFAPDARAPVAFVAGVSGPLIGADLLHLKDISRISTGVASIGGAGTFDGIVLSGIVAAYLA